MNVAKLYRLLIDPRARRTASTAIQHTGASRTIYDCVCGAEHTCATSYRNAKHVRVWREAHADCMDRAVASRLAELI